jgi:hypothetical protein
MEYVIFEKIVKKVKFVILPNKGVKTMKKPKFIEDEERKQYVKRQNEFSQKINPKPSNEEREQLKKAYLEKRKSSLE